MYRKSFWFSLATLLLASILGACDYIKVVSVSSSGAVGDEESDGPSISDDGRFVAFHSYSWNLAPGKERYRSSIYIHNTRDGTTERISNNHEGLEANGNSFRPSISPDGRYVAFRSTASDLIDTAPPPFAHLYYNIYLHDRQTQTTSAISTNDSGQLGNRDSYGAKISADTRFIAFESSSYNLTANDDNLAWDVFVHDRSSGKTTVASVSTHGVLGNGVSGQPSISSRRKICGL